MHIVNIKKPYPRVYWRQKKRSCSFHVAFLYNSNPITALVHANYTPHTRRRRQHTLGLSDLITSPPCAVRTIHINVGFSDVHGSHTKPSRAFFCCLYLFHIPYALRLNHFSVSNLSKVLTHGTHALHHQPHDAVCGRGSACGRTY